MLILGDHSYTSSLLTADEMVRKYGLPKQFFRRTRDGGALWEPWARQAASDGNGLLRTRETDRDGRQIVITPLAGGAGMALVERYVGTDTPASVGASVLPRFIDLPRDFIYAALMLQFSGTLTIAGGTTNGTPVDENPMEFIERIVVEGTGGGSALQIKNNRARMFYRAQHLLMGKEPNAVPITSGAIGGPTAWSFMCFLWFALPGAQVPPEISVQSVLDPSEYGKLTLEIDYGVTTDFIVAGDRTVTVPSAQSDVYALQPINVNLTKNRPYRYIETLFLQDSVAALATERRLSNPIPVGRPIRYILEETRNEASPLKQPVDDTIGTTKIFISQTLLGRWNTFRAIVDRNRTDNKVIDAINPAGLDALSSRDNPAIGYYIWDFAKGGRLDGVLDASRFPSRGVPIDFLQDILTASARQIYISLGYLVPGGPR